MKYTALHLHTTIGSLLDGVGTPEEYFTYAKELGIEALAVTDHGMMSAHREWLKAGKEHGIKPILGIEAYYTDDRWDRTAKKNRNMDSIYEHLILIAQNDTGLRNLYKLSEESAKSFWHKPLIDAELLEMYGEGIIATSACIGGVVAKPLQQGLKSFAEQRARQFAELFPGRFYIEHQHHNPDDITEELVRIAKKFDLPMVVTDDCHHPRPEDLELQEVMLCLATKPTRNKEFNIEHASKLPLLERLDYTYPDRKLTFTKYGLHLKSAEEHAKLLTERGLPLDLITNTQVIADSVEEYTYYENLQTLPKTENSDASLRAKVIAGLKAMGKTSQEYRDRVDHELSVIEQLNFSDYFHLIEDMVAWADEQGIRRGPGRGSGVGSLVNYALGITKIDPIEYHLLFERFLDLSRPEMPDIDLDYTPAGRNRVKDYVRDKYGYVAGIATFGQFKDKGAIRDVCRVLGIPLGETNKVLKKVHDFDDFESSPDAKEFRNKYPEVTKLVRQMQGRIRTMGVHAGGLVVSQNPISDIVPVHSAIPPGEEERVAVASYDMNEVADIGLVKVDALGLKTLAVLDNALELISQNHGEVIDLENLPLDDDKVYELISSGRTKGMFQASADPYTKLILDIGGVWTFDELVASNALVRPGAAKSSFYKQYVDGKNHGIINYHHEDVKQFTEKTYSSVLYQEQVMQYCTHLAGMSAAEANGVRKAISKKKAEELEKWKPLFVEGASEKIGKRKAGKLWHDFEASAEYQFNLSHAVAYSMITYQTAWLKTYYPMEFLIACVNQEKDKDARLDFFIDMKKMGIRIKTPDINDSDLLFSVQEDERGKFVRMGLAGIKYISAKVGQNIIKHRPYKTYKDVVDVVEKKGSGVNISALKALNYVGAAKLEGNTHSYGREHWYEYLNLPAFSTEEVPEHIMAQLRPLDEFDEDGAFLAFGMVKGSKTGQGWRRIDIVDSTGTAGVFVNEGSAIEDGNAYIFLIADNSVVRYIKLSDVEAKQGSFYSFLNAESFPDVPSGMQKVVAFAPRKTKAGKKMATVVFADESKSLTAALVWPSYFMAAYSKCSDGAVLDVKLEETNTGSLFLSNIL